MRVVLLLSTLNLLPITAASAETLDCSCDVGAAKVSLRIDLQALTVKQTVQVGSITESAEYKDGVYGTVSHTGNAALIPSVHQFVRVDGNAIYYGAELHGVETGATLDRSLSMITLPN